MEKFMHDHQCSVQPQLAESGVMQGFVQQGYEAQRRIGPRHAADSEPLLMLIRPHAANSQNYESAIS